MFNFFRGEDKQSLEKPKKHVEKTQPLSYLGGESSKNSVGRVFANIGTSNGSSYAAGNATDGRWIGGLDLPTYRMAEPLLRAKSVSHSSPCALLSAVWSLSEQTEHSSSWDMSFDVDWLFVFENCLVKSLRMCVWHAWDLCLHRLEILEVVVFSLERHDQDSPLKSIKDCPKSARWILRAVHRECCVTRTSSIKSALSGFLFLQILRNSWPSEQRPPMLVKMKGKHGLGFNLRPSESFSG